MLSEQTILERVDEYALYCFYLGYAPTIGQSIISPIRGQCNPDTVGSFSIFYPTRTKTNFEFLWADNGTGQRGNIFQMVSAIYGGITISAVYQLIDHDFKLGFGDGAPIYHRIDPGVKPEILPPCDIKVRSRDMRPKDLDYWAQYGIGPEILAMYNITSVDMYWLSKFQRHPKVPGSSLCFAYRIWSKYKIYRPFAPRKDKFRNDFSPTHIEGYQQLKYNSETLIITKALKDVAMFRAIADIDAVAGKGENIPIPDIALRYFESRYKRIVVWNDNDGKESGAKYYPNYERVYNPPGPKDPSDYRQVNGENATLELISNLVSLC